jgi:hypothetical protein|tara:strand:- start:2345 stop:2551 length:207 start_codon:yes stop_codon:yes gene_type:complete
MTEKEYNRMHNNGKIIFKFTRKDDVRKVRELVDQLVYELVEDEVPFQRLHALAWDIVNATRQKEQNDE